MSAVVVGAGLGGLAAAVRLAAAGRAVTVVEAGAGPGGKAGEVMVDGVAFDTGPSLLTLPWILRDLLSLVDVDLDDVLTLRQPDPAFRYLWPDGTVLDVFQDPAETVRSVERALGAAAAAEMSGFLDHARRIWEAAAPHFVLAAAPSFATMARLGASGLAAVSRIDPLRSMEAAVHSQVRTPHLRDLLLRFATYNGSDPRVAPGTLNCIAHVELGEGAFGVQGGIHQIAVALARVAASRGVVFRYDARVQAIETDRRGVTGVVLADGERLQTRTLVVNADVSHLVADLLPEASRHGLRGDLPPSTSGWTAVVRARRRDRQPHQVLFPSDYRQEFIDLFDKDRPPVEPTVYLCAQEPAHGRTGWAEHEPVFVMANAPAEPAAGPRAPVTWERLREAVWGRLLQADLIDSDDTIVWQRSPAGLAERFPGSRGALYGAASNSTFSAFRRPPNRVSRVRGLYLASGSAHPGGGMPLCLQSGRLAAEAVLEDA